MREDFTGDSGKSSLLDSWNCLATGNDRSKDVTLHSNTQRERDDIQKEEIGGVSGSSLS